jgi:pilus assembly protein FimV
LVNKGGIVHNLTFKKITVALCMAFMPLSLFAAGLGKLNVMSGLGEPLKADIELISVTSADLSSITAAIASEEAYTTQGIEKPSSHNTIKVEVGKNTSGAPILKLKSDQPITEPFLDMLIQVDWASGRLLREYTVLLDPPGYTGEAEPVVQDTLTASAPEINKSATDTAVAKNIDATPSDTVASSTSQNLASSSKKKNKRVKKLEPMTEIDPVVADVPASDNTGQEHFTQKGDTLAKIAREMKPEGISLEQMLVGLYQANPDAFQGNNMNRLKVGQIIRQPSQESLNLISSKDASREIKVQTANWNAYRNKLAGIVEESKPADSELGGTQSAGGKIKSAAEDKSLPAKGPQDVVKLSAGDASKATGENVKSLQDKITTLQEESTAREKSLKEAQDRTSELEKQIADMQKLLALKNGTMAEMQKQAEVAQVKPVEAPPTEVKPIEAAEPAKPSETVVVAEKPTEPAPQEQSKPESAPAPVAMQEQMPESSFLDDVFGGLDSGSLLPIGGGMLALLGGGWFYLRKKREKNLADFEQGIMTSGGLKANTVFGNTGTASVDTGDTSFLTDFSQSASGGMIDTNDVDPIAEAEVYMAYGRDAQAEEILKDAISKEPKRYELHLKLLDMYAASKNMSAFETISGELYTTLGASDPTWAKVAAIGIKLEPNNPLYQAGSVPQGTSDSSASSNSGKQEAKSKLDASDFSDSPLAAEKDLDFTIDSESKGFAPTGTFKSGEFDLDLGNSTSQNSKIEADVKEVPTMNFEMNIPAESSVNEAEKNDGGMDFDFGALGTPEVSENLTDNLEDPVKKVAEFVQTMPSLDIDTYQEPKFMPESASELSGATNDKISNLKDAITLGGFELPLTSENSEEAGVLDISGLDTDSKVSADDFNFNLNTLQPDLQKAKHEEISTLDVELESKEEASTVDLSGIDLDLNGSDSVAETIAYASEPIEVETKLELVAAYIEMDDKEGAKELLDEVMKEGGLNQRKRAEELLSKIA